MRRVLGTLSVLCMSGLALTLITVYGLRERLNTPADEMETLLPMCREVIQAEGEFRNAAGRYGTLEELLNAGRMGVKGIVKITERGYSYELRNRDNEYAIFLFPSSSGASLPSRRLSLYADQTSRVRFEYGRGKAGPESAPIPKYEESRQ